MSSENRNASGYAPYSHDEVTHQPQGQGIRSSGPSDATEARNTTQQENVDENFQLQNENEDADEQLETFAEGDVAHAVQRKSGTQKAPGEEVVEHDFTEELDRKKREQADAREKIKAQRSAGVNVDGGLGRERVGNEDLRDV
ncbi:hypothetical protein SODALDRAFT_323553 [Sodiomyces alkalinus F11]|uniref:Uncharacterized protein n=1 Tax=Sodiomyces alkalinus (strain CBS 110278 / VKM F-3762 / F11) TaxID=1314773 RepID=A0A3N2PX96_SODAK|nr:hypothetical protein SODALDRAFT_323553 [Sodiomyces alkalinus F11]ROT39094.1 hypothetical protein SODALDRAFT_323553 [Sodiomyces alkalinus F11]